MTDWLGIKGKVVIVGEAHLVLVTALLKAC